MLEEKITNPTNKLFTMQGEYLRKKKEKEELFGKEEIKNKEVVYLLHDNITEKCPICKTIKNKTNPCGDCGYNK